MLNEYEEKKCAVIEKIDNGEMTRKEGGFELNLSLRQIDRLRKIYRTKGKDGLSHKGRGRTSPHKIKSDIVEDLETLYLNEYYDYNLTHFYEEIMENEKYKGIYDISYKSLHTIFLNDDIISPIAHKETIKLYNEKMSNAIKTEDTSISEEKKDLFVTRQISYEQAKTRKSSNMFAFGQEVQMDACENKWFGNVITYLHLAVDKATKKVLFGWFEYEEITRGYFVLLYNTIINYGIPARIKTDNRNSFSNQKNKVDTTQFGTICKTLNIELITTSVATAKPHVERENKTFKDRLIAEFRHEKITDIDKANEYLNTIFIPKMNKKFSYQIDEKTSQMRPNNYTLEELNLIISEKTNRIIDNAGSIKYNNKYYTPFNTETNKIVPFMKRTECTIIISYNGEYWCQIENNYYLLKEIESRDTTMKKEIENKKPIKRKKYIPPENHPWRKKRRSRQNI